MPDAAAQVCTLSAIRIGQYYHNEVLSTKFLSKTFLSKSVQCNFNVSSVAISSLIKLGRPKLKRASKSTQCCLYSVQRSDTPSCKSLATKEHAENAQAKRQKVISREKSTQMDVRSLRHEGFLRNVATQVGLSASQWICKNDTNAGDAFNSIPSSEKQCSLAPLLEAVITLSEKYVDLTHSIHQGYGLADTYVQITRKSWNTFSFGDYPARLAVKPNGEASYFKLFLPTEHLDVVDPDQTLKSDLVTSVLHEISIQGWHFHCPGIEPKVIVDQKSRLLTKFAYPYVRYQSHTCKVYYIPPNNIPRASKWSGVHRCRNCNRTIKHLTARSVQSNKK